MFEYVSEFESQIAEFFGAPYAVATDSCTHALELCLRHTGENHILIDDLPNTIEEWNNKGGIGILHTSAATTIKELKKLGL